MVHLHEQVVLPRPMDHALDLARAEAAFPQESFALVLGFADAFSSTPLRPEERRFACAELELGFGAWRVLGCGG
eukprot:904046-Alexandrium_andersonii.AAC.1